MIYSCDTKPLLQCSVSHDPSEIILICRFAAQEAFIIIIIIIIINIENSCAAYFFISVFVGTMIFFFWIFLINEMFKKNSNLKYNSLLYSFYIFIFYTCINRVELLGFYCRVIIVN